MSSAVIGALRVVLGLDSAAFNQGLGASQKRLNEFRRNMERTGRRLQATGARMSVGVTAPLTLAFGGMMKSAGDFEKSMNRVQALSGATDTYLAQLKDTAKDLGATTQFSASQAADAMGFLAMAGFDANEIIGAMPSTLQLAAASGANLATSADIVSNIMTGYKKEVGDLAAVNDVLVKTLSSSNTNLSQMGDAMKYVAPVASSAKLRFNEVAAAIGLLGNAGIQGEMGGTALRGAITRLLNPTSTVAGVIEELGVDLYKANGQLKDLTDIVRELEPHAENTGAIMAMFGQRAGPGMAALISQGADELERFETSLNASGGTAERIAQTQMKGFNGAVREMRSALEGLAIAIADSGILEFVTKFVTQLTAFIREASSANPALFRMSVVAGALAAAIGPVVAAIGLMMVALTPMAGVIAAIVSPLGLLVAAIAAAGVAIYVNWGSLGEDFPAITGAIEAALAALAAAFSRILEAAQSLWSGVTEHLRLAATLIESLISGDIKGALSALGAMFGNLRDTIFGVLDALLGSLDEKLIGIASALIAPFKNWLSDAAALLMADPAVLGAAIGGALGGMVQKVKEVCTQIAAAFGAMLTDVAGLFEGGFGQAMLGANDALARFASDVVAALVQLAIDVGVAALDIGREIVAGIKQGLAEKWQDLKDYVSDLGSGLAQGFKDVLGIKSPSKVFKAFGGFIIDGLVKGMDGGMSRIQSAVDRMSGELQLPGIVSGSDQAAGAFDKIGKSAAGVFSDIGRWLGESTRSARSFNDVLGDVLGNLSNMLLQQAQASLTGLFGGSGSIGGALFGGLFGGLMGFANGGSFDVGGAGGIDSQIVAFRASPNESVHITKPGQGLSGGGASLVRLELSPELEGRILHKSQHQSLEITRAGLSEFDSGLPDRVAEISNDPRAR